MTRRKLAGVDRLVEVIADISEHGIERAQVAVGTVRLLMRLWCSLPLLPAEQVDNRLTGLVDGGSYNLYLYGSNVYGSGGTFSISTSTVASQSTTALRNATNGTYGSYTYGTPLEYVLFSTLIASSQGQIIFTVSPDASAQYPTNALINGFQLSGTFPQSHFPNRPNRHHGRR